MADLSQMACWIHFDVKFELYFYSNFTCVGPFVIQMTLCEHRNMKNMLTHYLTQKVTMFTDAYVSQLGVVVLSYHLPGITTLSGPFY